MSGDELRALREETKERLDDAIHDQRSMAAILRLRKTVAALDQAASDRAALDRFDEVGAYAALKEELESARIRHTEFGQAANKRVRHAERERDEARAALDRVRAFRDRLAEMVPASAFLGAALSQLDAALRDEQKEDHA